MSQYLNIYIKKKGEDKPSFFTEYSRSDDVYKAITDEVGAPYNEERDLTADELLRVLNKQKEDIARLEARINLRYKSLREVTNKEVTEEVLFEIDALSASLFDLKKTLEEVTHIFWLAAHLEDSDLYDWHEFEGLKISIG